MRSRWFGLVIALLAVVISVWAYPRLSPTVATHWNLKGTPDGFSSRLVAVSIIPLFILAMTGLFNVLPKLDPMEALRRQRVYLAGLPEERVLALAAACFREVIQPRISPAGLATLRAHQAQGHMTVLLSGAPVFLLRPLQAYSGADHLIATAQAEIRTAFQIQ